MHRHQCEIFSLNSVFIALTTAHLCPVSSIRPSEQWTNQLGGLGGCPGHFERDEEGERSYEDEGVEERKRKRLQTLLGRKRRKENC